MNDSRLLAIISKVQSEVDSGLDDDEPDQLTAAHVGSFTWQRVYEGALKDADDLVIAVDNGQFSDGGEGTWPLTDLYFWLRRLAQDSGPNGRLTITADYTVEASR